MVRKPVRDPCHCTSNFWLVVRMLVWRRVGSGGISCESLCVSSSPVTQRLQRWGELAVPNREKNRKLQNKKQKTSTLLFSILPYMTRFNHSRSLSSAQTQTPDFWRSRSSSSRHMSPSATSTGKEVYELLPGKKTAEFPLFRANISKSTYNNYDIDVISL